MATTRGACASGTVTGASRNSTSNTVNEIAHRNSKITTRSVHDRPRFNIVALSSFVATTMSSSNTKGKARNKKAAASTTTAAASSSSSASSSAATATASKAGGKAQLQHQQNVRPAENAALTAAETAMSERVDNAARVILKSGQPLTEELLSAVLRDVDVRTDAQMAQFKADYIASLRAQRPAGKGAKSGGGGGGGGKSEQELAGAFHHAVGFMESNMPTILYDTAVRMRDERAKFVADRKAQLAQLEAERDRRLASMPPPPLPPHDAASNYEALVDVDELDDWRDGLADLPPLELADGGSLLSDDDDNDNNDNNVDDGPVDELYDVD
jgi:hypothetical protein